MAGSRPSRPGSSDARAEIMILRHKLHMADIQRDAERKQVAELRRIHDELTQERVEKLRQLDELQEKTVVLAQKVAEERAKRDAARRTLGRVQRVRSWRPHHPQSSGRGGDGGKGDWGKDKRKGGGWGGGAGGGARAPGGP
jgi:hypothetical protein